MTEAKAPPPACLLRVRDLGISFAGGRRAVDGVGFALGPGAILGIVGESGSGKSMSALAVMGLLPPGARVESGSIELASEGGVVDVLSMSPRRARGIRGRGVAMIFQEPMSALNPVFTVGDQVEEAVRLHSPGGRTRRRALDALAEAGIDDPARRAAQYPHELSGGLRQRVCIALALACNPRLLIADEPTTALDASVQARILELLADLRRSRGLAIILITHALGVAERFADAVGVMESGRLVEFGPASRVLRDPAHPYTRALTACAPRLDRPASRLRTIADEMSAGVPGDATTWWPRAGRAGPSRMAEHGPGHWVAELGTGGEEVPFGAFPSADMHIAGMIAGGCRKEPWHGHGKPESNAEI